MHIFCPLWIYRIITWLLQYINSNAALIYTFEALRLSACYFCRLKSLTQAARGLLSSMSLSSQPPLQMKMRPMETFADERFIIILYLVTYANFLPHPPTFSADVVATGDQMKCSISFLKWRIFWGLNFVVNTFQCRNATCYITSYATSYFDCIYEGKMSIFIQLHFIYLTGVITSYFSKEDFKHKTRSSRFRLSLIVVAIDSSVLEKMTRVNHEFFKENLLCHWSTFLGIREAVLTVSQVSWFYSGVSFHHVFWLQRTVWVQIRLPNTINCSSPLSVTH